MMLEENAPELAAEKEVKVKIPTTFHLRLHSLKILTGKQISTTVTEALTHYFDELQEDAEGDQDG